MTSTGSSAGGQYGVFGVDRGHVSSFGIHRGSDAAVAEPTRDPYDGLDVGAFVSLIVNGGIAR